MLGYWDDKKSTLSICIYWVWYLMAYICHMPYMYHTAHAMARFVRLVCFIINQLMVHIDLFFSLIILTAIAVYWPHCNDKSAVQEVRRAPINNNEILTAQRQDLQQQNLVRKLYSYTKGMYHIEWRIFSCFGTKLIWVIRAKKLISKNIHEHPCLMESVENMIVQNVFALELCASKMALNLLTGILFKNNRWFIH